MVGVGRHVRKQILLSPTPFASPHRIPRLTDALRSGRGSYRYIPRTFSRLKRSPDFHRDKLRKGISVDSPYIPVNAFRVPAPDLSATDALRSGRGERCKGGGEILNPFDSAQGRLEFRMTVALVRGDSWLCWVWGFYYAAESVSFKATISRRRARILASA